MEEEKWKNKNVGKERKAGNEKMEVKKCVVREKKK